MTIVTKARPHDPLTPSELLKLRGMRRMKTVATGFLLAAAVVYIIMKILQNHGVTGWTGYVEAAAEAGMVGGLADWFAVTALFKHPLGAADPAHRDHPQPQGPVRRGPGHLRRRELPVRGRHPRPAVRARHLPPHRPVALAAGERRARDQGAGDRACAEC